MSYNRFVEVNDKLAGAKLEADGLRKQIEELQTVAQQVPQLQAHAQQWQEQAQIYRAGLIDDEGITVARALHAALPPEERPPLPDWLGSLKSDPSKAPKALAPYFAAPSSGAAGSSPPAVPQGGAVPSGAGAAAAHPPALITHEVLKALDPKSAEWVQAMAAYKKQITPKK